MRTCKFRNCQCLSESKNIYIFLKKKPTLLYTLQTHKSLCPGKHLWLQRWTGIIAKCSCLRTMQLLLAMTVLLDGWCRKWQPLGVLQRKMVLLDSGDVSLTLFYCLGLTKCYKSLCVQFARKAGRLAWLSVLAAPDLVITVIAITRMDLTNLVFNCLNRLSWKLWLLNIRQIKQMALEGLWKMGWSCRSSAAILVAWSVQRHCYMTLSAMCQEIYSFVSLG